MAIDIANAGKTAINAGTAQLKTFVLPILVGTFCIALIVGFIPALKKFI